MKKVVIFIVCFLFMHIGIAQLSDNVVLQKDYNRKIDSLLKHYKKKINVENPNYAIYYEDNITVYGYENSLINIDTSFIEAVRIMTAKEVQTFFGKNIADTALIEIQYINSKNRCSPIQSKTPIIQIADNKLISKKRKKVSIRKSVPTYCDIKVNFIGYEDVENGETVDEPFFYKCLKKRMNVTINTDNTDLSGKVILQFILERDASVSDVQLVPNSPVKNLSMVEEARRLLKKISRRWRPISSEKKGVRSYHKVVFDFKLVYDK